jgi:hypothetical protein
MPVVDDTLALLMSFDSSSILAPLRNGSGATVSTLGRCADNRLVIIVLTDITNELLSETDRDATLEPGCTFQNASSTRAVENGREKT